MTFDDFLSEWNNDKDFIIAYSSGSTGAPKEIKLKKEFVARSAERTIDFFGITGQDNLHSCVSPDFIGGKMMAVRAILANANLSWENPTNKPLQNFDINTKIDLLAVVPSQMPHLLENKGKIPEIKNIIVGGSPIHPVLRHKIASSGLNVYETYGMTETASHIALRKISYDLNPFKTLPGIKVDVDNYGSLIIEFSDGYEIYTNDVAEVVSSIEFFIKGRKDQMIISGGRKINPVEIEEKISCFIPYPFCITGFPDEKWGEKVVLLVQNKTGDNDLKEIEISHLKERLSNILEKWQLPKEIHFVDTLKLTSNGKIIRPRSLAEIK